MRLTPLLILWPLVYGIACKDDESDTSDTSDTDPPADVLTDNGDGTFTSSATGWTWEGVPTTDKFRWADAKTHCDTLALDGGGWHLPTITELRSLVRGCEGTVTDGACPADDECADAACRAATCYACALEEGPNGGCYGPVELAGACDTFWSATEVGDNPGSAWFISFNDGHVYSYGVGNNYSVRCVRP